jgi:hypothetical protein
VNTTTLEKEQTRFAASPFFPGQPVPANLFVGRTEELKRFDRALLQVSSGRQRAIYIAGEHGMGKSSLTNYISQQARQKHHLLPLHVMLGGSLTLEDVAIRTVETLLQQAWHSNLKDKVQLLLGRYFNKQDIFGFTINQDNLQADAAAISRSFLPFLLNFYEFTQDENHRGLVLIFDEIDGVSSNAAFAHFLKSLVDTNGLNNRQLPLLLVLCGVEDRRQEIIDFHKPIERIFEIIDIQPLTHNEALTFFRKAFALTDLQVHEHAYELMAYYSKGIPKVMQIIGESVYWSAKNNSISLDTAMEGIMSAAEEIRRRFVDDQVYKSIRTNDYKNFLMKITASSYNDPFQS